MLFLSTRYGFDRSGTADAYRLKELSCAIQRRGVQTEFLSLREMPVRRPVLAQPLNLPFVRKKIIDCDFIHAGSDAAYVASVWKPFTRARIIHDVHGDTLSEARLNWSVGPSPRRAYWVLQAMIANVVALHRADYFLAVSVPMVNWLSSQKHIASPRIGIVRNGVDLKLFSRSPRRRTNAFTVCYAGGFQSWQSIEDLVTAFEILSIDGVHLKIIGFTGRDADLKADIAGRLGHRAELVDKIPQRELVEHLKAADVLTIPRFKHPAAEVALPTKFAEYLSLGRPLIVNNVDETADLVRQHHCGLVTEPNAEALADAIKIASNLSQEEMRQMGRNARHLAESKFSWDDIGQRYAELLIRWMT